MKGHLYFSFKTKFPFYLYWTNESSRNTVEIRMNYIPIQFCKYSIINRLMWTWKLMESIPLTHGKHNYNQVEPHTGVSFILPYTRNVRQLTVSKLPWWEKIYNRAIYYLLMKLHSIKEFLQGISFWNNIYVQFSRGEHWLLISIANLPSSPEEKAHKLFDWIVVGGLKLWWKAM